MSDLTNTECGDTFAASGTAFVRAAGHVLVTARADSEQEAMAIRDAAMAALETVAPVPHVEEVARAIRDAVGHFRMSESMAEIAAGAAVELFKENRP